MSRVRVRQIKGTETSAIEGVSLYLPSYLRVGKERGREREKKPGFGNVNQLTVADISPTAVSFP